VTDEGTDLERLLRTLTPGAREALLAALIRDQAELDAIAQELLRYCDDNGD
jgi:hypothetical protein